MWEGLIILGLTAAGCVTAITLKALSFAELLEKEEPDEKNRELQRARELEEEAEKEYKASHP
jgi:hypothetical protein